MRLNSRQDTSEITRGLLLFGLTTLLIFCLLTFLFIALYLIFSNAGTNNPLDTPDKSQTLTALLGLLFGSAAAIGGAIATIHVASLGLEVSKRQEEIFKKQELRESSAFLDGKASKSINLFSDLLVSINEVYSSGVIVYLKLPEIDEEKLDKHFPCEIPPDLKNEMQQLSDKLTNLVKSINNILRDDFANYCIQQQASDYHGKLEHLSRELCIQGLPLNEVNTSAKDLSDIAALLELAGRDINASKFKDLIVAYLASKESDNEIYSVKHNNANVRSFFFTGNLLNLRWDKNTPAGKTVIASFGAAIIHDIIQVVPEGDDISKYLTFKYPDNSALKTHKVFFKPQDITSKGLLAAIKEAEQIGDLYLLIGNV